MAVKSKAAPSRAAGPMPSLERIAALLRAWADEPAAAALDEAYPAAPGLSTLGAALEAARPAALALGLPPSLAAPLFVVGSQYSAATNLTLHCAMASSGAPGLMAECAEAGLDPWILSGGRTSLGPDRSIVREVDVFLADPEPMARLCMGERVGNLAAGMPHCRYANELKGKAVRLAMAAMAAERAPDHGPELAKGFALAMSRHFAQAADASMAGAAGVMGAMDQRAKSCAEALLRVGDAMRLACSGDADAAKEAEASLVRARSLLEAKTAKAAFDPAKAKRAMPAERKERLSTLLLLLNRQGYDPGPALLVAAATPWLAEDPHALCLSMRGEPSVLSAALGARVFGLLEIAERGGSNIWIAAAQDGQSNACQWVAESLWNEVPDEAADRLARMLAWGAHLDGAADPVGHALKKMREVDAQSCPQAPRLAAAIETIVFASMLSERERASPAAEAGEASEPRKARRSAL